MIYRLLLIVLALLLQAEASSAEFSVGPHGFGVSIVGPLKRDDYIRFNYFMLKNIRKADYDTVFLNSPGGDVEEALMFAQRFRTHFSTVVVEAGSKCFSACTIVWAGGVERYLFDDAKLGFHRLSTTSNEIDVNKVKRRVDPVSKKVSDFFTETGLPRALIDKMNETPPTDMFVIDMRWLVENGLDRTVAYQPSFVDVVERRCGIDPTSIAAKESRQLSAEEQDSLMKWMLCADSVKVANRNLKKG
jgi:hypothetical protein